MATDLARVALPFACVAFTSGSRGWVRQPGSRQPTWRGVCVYFRGVSRIGFVLVPSKDGFMCPVRLSGRASSQCQDGCDHTNWVPTTGGSSCRLVGLSSFSSAAFLRFAAADAGFLPADCGRCRSGWLSVLGPILALQDRRANRHPYKAWVSYSIIVGIWLANAISESMPSVPVRPPYRGCLLEADSAIPAGTRTRLP